MALTWVTLSAAAQGGYNFNSFGVGFGLSRIRPQADLINNYNDYAANVNFTYYYSPYIPVAVEFQMGRLRGGGNTVAEDKDTRRFDNKYKALLLHVDYQLGEAIDYERNGFLNIIKNFYVGGGVGFMFNSVDVNRESFIDPGYIFPGKDKSINLTVPLRIGYEFKIYDYNGFPKFNIILGYEHNVTFGEGLDGYNDPSSKFKNNALDQYRQMSIGIKYNFGLESSYEKSIKGSGY